jgi:hypothetical protein
MTAIHALIVAVTLSAPAATAPADGNAPALRPLAAAVATVPAVETALEPWMIDRKVSRPAAISVLYATLGGLQALDIYSTRRALRSGAAEVNPLMKPAAGAGAGAAMIAAKAVSTATSIYFTERVWKKNRKGAVVLMAVVNGVTAAVVARNLRNAR